jgi:hypothetical protein
MLCMLCFVASQELEAVLVLTQPSVLTKRLLLRYQPEQQLQQLKQQLMNQALPAIMQVRMRRGWMQQRSWLLNVLSVQRMA